MVFKCAHRDAIFNIVITPFRDMFDISAVWRGAKDDLNLGLDPKDRSQGTHKRLRYLILGCLNGVAAE